MNRHLHVMSLISFWMTQDGTEGLNLMIAHAKGLSFRELVLLLHLARIEESRGESYDNILEVNRFPPTLL